MRICEKVKDINKKVSINPTRVMSVKRYYLSLYRANMVYLYDNGYISDPTVFNEKEILANMLDMNVKGIVGVTGKVELSEKFIKYALYKNKGDEDISHFLKILYNAVLNRNISLNIDKLYDSFNLSEGKKKKVSLSLVQSGSRIYSKNNFRLDEGVFKCLDVYGSMTTFVSLNEFIYNSALEELGIVKEDSSLFVDGLTCEEEIECCELILNGYIPLDGKYKNKLEAWLSNNKWSGSREYYKSEGLYNWVMYLKAQSMIEEQSRVMNSLLDDGYNVRGMQSNGFFIDVDEDILFPVGIFVVDGGCDDLLPDYNKLEGYTGEVFSIDYLLENDIQYVGCPIILKDIKGSDRYYIDKEQTELKDTDSWFKVYNADLSFEGSTYREGVFSDGTVEDNIYKILGDSEEGILIGSISNEMKGKDLSSAKKTVINKV